MHQCASNNQNELFTFAFGWTGLFLDELGQRHFVVVDGIIGRLLFRTAKVMPVSSKTMKGTVLGQDGIELGLEKLFLRRWIILSNHRLDFGFGVVGDHPVMVQLNAIACVVQQCTRVEPSSTMGN